MINIIPRLFCVVLILISQTYVHALSLDDEERAQDLFKEIRCLVCQSQTIHESNSELAEDLKQLIRKQISDGKTDENIKLFLVDKYGDWILMTPPFNQYTYFLWISPIIVLILGLFFIVRKSQKSE
tara:strand:- start:39 stop:416 length:378 start_codon:yes stop_codon:yes gene_type:complete